MTPDQSFWTSAERIATLLAAGAGLLGVILGAWSLGVSRGQERKHRSGQAAIILNVADLIRQRIERWKKDFGMMTEWPTGEEFDNWLRRIEQDVSLAGTMQDRAATIDLKTLSYADMVWRGFVDIRFRLGYGKAWWANIQRKYPDTPDHVEFGWKNKHRVELLVTCEVVIGTLDALESLFEESVRTINGHTRSQHKAELQAQIENAARPRAIAFAEEAGQPIEMRGPPIPPEWFG